MTDPYPSPEEQRLSAKLWACASAARGDKPALREGDGNWSSAYSQVFELRARYEKTSLEGLLHQARGIWGPQFKQPLEEIVVRLMVGVGDLARKARDRCPATLTVSQSLGHEPIAPPQYTRDRDAWRAEVRKELGNLIFSTIRWCDDMGFRPEECVQAAIEAQVKFASSKRPR